MNKPFAMGLSVIPITSVGLDQPGTAKKVSTGIPSLDKMFRGDPGYIRGSRLYLFFQHEKNYLQVVNLSD
ncbi:MAG: hypothetical protein ACM3RX_09195 [Methanococcaceae archaeon]